MLENFFKRFKKGQPEEEQLVDQMETEETFVESEDQGQDLLLDEAEALDQEAESLVEESDQEVEEAPACGSSELEPEEKEETGFFGKLMAGLKKTRDNLSRQVDRIIHGRTEIDEDLYEELEDLMVSSDMGVQTTMTVMDILRDRVDEGRITEPSQVKGELNAILKEQVRAKQGDAVFKLEDGVPTVLLVIGVNGVGKTTTIGKLAARYQRQGKKVILAAADTFRAAAIDQLGEWAKRAGVDMVAHSEGSDPAAVIYDAIASARSQEADLLICDTAGRLHNKKNLMNELEKINRVIDREYPQANKEVFIVLDATTGQNAVSQTREFKEVADVSGIVLTKLDGTAKGGVVFPLQIELAVPVMFIGVGEQIDDLQPFEIDAFVDAIIS